MGAVLAAAAADDDAVAATAAGLLALTPRTLKFISIVGCSGPARDWRWDSRRAAPALLGRPHDWVATLPMPMSTPVPISKPVPVTTPVTV